MITNILKFKIHSCIFSSDVNEYLYAGFKIVSLSISSFSGVFACKKIDGNSKESAFSISSINGSNGNVKATGTKPTISAKHEEDGTNKHSTVLISTQKFIEDRIATAVPKTIPYVEVMTHDLISNPIHITNVSPTTGTMIEADKQEILVSAKTTVIEASQLTEMEVEVSVECSQEASPLSHTTPLPAPIVFSEIDRKESTDSSSSPQDDTCDSDSKRAETNTDETPADSEKCDPEPVDNNNSIPEVPGLSDKVLKVPNQPVGPNAGKNSTYKNPEYFSYHKDSFIEALVELLKYRLAQPSIHEPYYHEKK